MFAIEDDSMKLLFVCTHNRCRSICAEAVARHVLGAGFDVRSAGSQPAGVVYPGSVAALEQHGINTANLQSQSWDEFEAFAPDYVITVCDSAANEACPLWMGEGKKVHWGLTDPSKLAEGEEQDAAFATLIQTLTKRLESVKGLAGEVSADETRAQLQALADVY